MLTATLGKAFCFPNKIPGLMLSSFTSQTQGSPNCCRKQKLDLCLLLVFAFVYPFTQHHASRQSCLCHSCGRCFEGLTGRYCTASGPALCFCAQIQDSMCHPEELEREMGQVGDADGEGNNLPDSPPVLAPPSGSLHRPSGQHWSQLHLHTGSWLRGNLRPGAGALR